MSNRPPDFKPPPPTSLIIINCRPHSTFAEQKNKRKKKFEPGLTHFSRTQEGEKTLQHLIAAIRLIRLSYSLVVRGGGEERRGGERENNLNFSPLFLSFFLTPSGDIGLGIKRRGRGNLLCALPMGIQGAERPPQILSFLATKPTSISPQKTEKKKGGTFFGRKMREFGRCPSGDMGLFLIPRGLRPPFWRRKKKNLWTGEISWGGKRFGGRYSVFWEMGAVFEPRKRHSLRKGEGGRNCEMGFFPGKEGRRN